MLHLTSTEAIHTLSAGRQDLSVVASMFPTQPDVMLGALVDACVDAGVRLRLFVGDVPGQYAFLGATPLSGRGVEVLSLAGRIPRSLGSCVRPFGSSLATIDRFLADASIRPDVVICQVGRPGPDGRMSLGPSIGYTPAAVRGAVVVVAVINPSIVAVGEHPGLDPADVDFVVDGAELLGEVPAADPTPEVDAAARHAASVIPDGATIQIGLGGVPEAVLGHLADRTDLGFHSGILSDRAFALIRAGVITGTRKSSDPGRHVATALVGSRELYLAASDAQTGIALREIARTHGSAELARLERLFAVSSGFEVDVFGQVNAEYVDGLPAASSGGQREFGAAAHGSPGGAHIVALTARAAGGQPRIVPRLGRPNWVTTPASDVDMVVTEYGIASLAGRSVDERALAIAAVAHPDDRHVLLRAGRIRA